MKITEYSAQGPRPEQEDRYITIKHDTGTLLAVFDGHGGSEVADIAVNFLKNYYAENVTPEEMLRDIFSQLDKLTHFYDSGSTASIVFIPKDESKVYVAILGDSPVVIWDGKELHISPEHNIRTNANEVRAVQERGGSFYNGYVFKDMGTFGKGLQMSRSLGDSSLRGVVIQEPEIYSVNLNDFYWVLVGSDGLFDPAHMDKGKTINQVKYMIAYGSDAQDLVTFALNGKVYDNVTAILVKDETELLSAHVGQFADFQNDLIPEEVLDSLQYQPTGSEYSYA